VPTYKEIGFEHVKFPNRQVHLDPEFKTFTYGHVKRGFGDLQCLLRLKKSDVLFFYATLQKEEDWSTYIIGYFKNLTIYDCRKLPKREILSFKSKGFANNAHLKRANPSVDLLIKGREGSKLLNKAFPIAEDKDCLTIRRPLKNIILSVTGKKIKPGAPWYRWALTSKNPHELIEKIEGWQK
jgi:hypothetical protein